MSEQCAICQKTFNKKCNLYRHYRNVHNREPDIKSNIKHTLKYKCLESGCDNSFIQNSELLSHLEIHHNLKIKRERKEFKYFQEFISWKNDIERKEVCNYIVSSGTRKSTVGSDITYYRCNRSARDARKSNNTRREKTQGSCKLQSNCTSQMTVEENNGVVTVNRVVNHYGHNLDLAHLRMSQVDKEEIAGKLLNGVTPTRLFLLKRFKMSSKRKRKDPYDQEAINKAIEAMEKGVSSRDAARKFGVPRSTLYAKYIMMTPIDAKQGPSTVLTAEEEDGIVFWISYVASRGFPVTKSVLLQHVEGIAKKIDRPNPFKNGKPGRHWFEAFIRRHPEVAVYLSPNLQILKRSATKPAILKWFSEVRNHLEPLNLLNIDPSRIFNLDESAFFLNPNSKKVLARKDDTGVYKVMEGDDEESLTVLFNLNAKGQVLPPMVLFWYEKQKNMPPEWIAETTETGWMTPDCFYKYISTQFYPWLVKKKIEFPVVLYIDAHASHLTLDLCQFCKQHQIEVIGLYPNSTHLIQPLDVALFRPLKQYYKDQVDKWTIENNGKQIKSENFPSIIKNTLDSMDNLSDMIKNGFAATGLYPFRPDTLDSVAEERNNCVCQSDELTIGLDFLEKSPLSPEVIVTLPNNNNSVPGKSQIKNNCVSQLDDELKIALDFFEKLLPPEALQNFKNVELGQDVIAEVYNVGLYNHWKCMKKLLHERNKVSTLGS